MCSVCTNSEFQSESWTREDGTHVPTPSSRISGATPTIQHCFLESVHHNSKQYNFQIEAISRRGEEESDQDVYSMCCSCIQATLIEIAASAQNPQFCLYGWIQICRFLCFGLNPPIGKSFFGLFWLKVASCLCKECRQTGGTKSRLSPYLIQCSSILSRYTSSEQIHFGGAGFCQLITKSIGSAEMIAFQNRCLFGLFECCQISFQEIYKDNFASSNVYLKVYLVFYT